MTGDTYVLDTVEARKLECDRPLLPNQKKEGKPAYITLDPYSNLLGVYCTLRDGKAGDCQKR